MKLAAFRVAKFRNIIDSEQIQVDPSVTCLVGKNEAGKSALIEALYLFNPAYGEKFEVADQYPRWLAVQDRRSGDLDKATPITVTLNLEPDDKQAVSAALGEGVLAGNTLTIKKKYGGGTVWIFQHSEDKAIRNLVSEFPPTIASFLGDNVDSLDRIKAFLKSTAPDEAGETGPSAEDIRSASSAIKARGIKAISIWKRIVNILRPRLPRFFRFTGYSTLPGRIDFRKLRTGDEERPAETGLQTARALLRLAGTDLEQLENDDYELRKGELEAVQIDLTNQVFEYWKQNPSLEVQIDVDKETLSTDSGSTSVARFLDIRLRDKRTGYSNNFSQRSSGFQWFFSFLAAFSEFEDKESPIVLLDEPALALHGRAQGDFLRFINERLAPSAPVVYTTHSPFMVEPGRLARVRIVEDQGPPVGATATDQVLVSDPDSLFPLQAALGYDIAQNLFVGPNNLVIEGTSDYIYLTLMSAACLGSKREGLDERWRLLPAGGATNIPTFVSLVGPHLDVTVLADSDTKGMQRITNMIDRKLLEGHRLIMPTIATDSNQADIEDLFSEGDYLKLYNKTHGASIKVGDLPKGDRIVKRLEGLEGSFDHGEVAETLLRHHHELPFTKSTLDRFATLIREINKTIDT